MFVKPVLNSIISLVSFSISGKLEIGLYDKAEKFLKIDKIYQGSSININEKNFKVIFKNIPNGVYAISLYHDTNENKKLDKNFFGIPQEGYGFSNNIRPKFRSANFEESKFNLNSDKTITIKIGY